MKAVVYVDRNVAATRDRQYEVLDSHSETEQADISRHRCRLKT